MQIERGRCARFSCRFRITTIPNVNWPGNRETALDRDRTDSESRALGYKNGLKLNAELATAEAWSMEQIDARTTTLVDQVVSFFAMTGKPSAYRRTVPWQSKM